MIIKSKVIKENEFLYKDKNLLTILIATTLRGYNLGFMGVFLGVYFYFIGLKNKASDGSWVDLPLYIYGEDGHQYPQIKKAKGTLGRYDTKAADGSNTSLYRIRHGIQRCFISGSDFSKTDFRKH